MKRWWVLVVVALGALAAPASALAEDFKPEDEFKLDTWVSIHLGPLDMSINKAVAYLWLGSVVTIVIGIVLMRVRLRVKPGTRQTIGETLYEVAQVQIAPGATADVLAKAGKDAVPVGQLWLVKLAPLSDGRVVPASKLRVVHLNYRDKEADAPCCALGVRKTSSGGLELLVYGKETEPVLHVPLKGISSTQDNPIEMSAERKDDGGLITLSFLGRYSASFMVTDPDQN